jgi:bile acid-coenzyme A ligase
VTGPAEEISFGDQLARVAAADPEGVGLVVVARDGSERTLTWTQLDAGANQWSRTLAARGVAAGDRVALAIQNSVEFVVGVLGAWKLGGVPIPVRWDLPEWERQRVLEVVDAKVVVDADSVADLASDAASRGAGPVTSVVSPQVFGICSSGATGTPKVIINTRPGVYLPALSDPFMTNWRAVDRPQVILVMGPMYHTNGFMTLQFLLGADRLVVMEKFDAPLILDVIERHRITNFTCTPTMLQRLADVPGIDERDLSSIDWILQGAAVMPPTLLRRWFELIGPERIVMAYGMTEQLGLTSLRGDEWLTHEGSVGRGFRDTEIKILDENQREVPVGELGDIYMRWPTTNAYDYRGGAPLLPTTPDGFGTAGDVGRVDADGYLYLADRRVDMIITGGANVFPAEVESALIDHPGIADVVVIGLQDPQWGRRVHAVVEAADPALTDTEVIAYAKGRLAAYKVPKTVEFVDAIPRSAATKVNRGAMVEARGG